MPTHGQPNPLAYLIPILVILPILYFRLRRMMKPRALKLNRMWIRPAILLFAGVAVLAASPPPVSEWFWFALAALMGAAFGWRWGKQMAIHVDPENGTLMTRGSQAALITMGILIVVRVGLRAGVRMESAALHLDATMITDLFIVFGATLFGLRGLEMFLRARRVLAQAPPSQAFPKA
ncbi:MAG TPA: hypothetical protein VN685_09050 [Rhizomicrobium sp.]|nr:hypothetical protein [Rhizomicrobium sp.]